jgi:hypothetical protein
MMNVLAILLAALGAPSFAGPPEGRQETKTIVRQEKNEYNAAVARCREGEGLIDSDPQQAVDKMTEVLALPKIRVWECSIRIEQRPAEYSDPYNFLPYQYRARARMNLAKKAQPESAQKLVASAIEDFQESVKRNVASSGEMLKAAEGVMAKLKEEMTRPTETVKANPLEKFREKWDPLMKARRFKAAKALIDKDSEGLTDDLKKGFLQTTEQGCRDLLVNWVADFRPNFIKAMGLGLDQKTPDEFELLFTLPATDELVVSHPAVDWARQYLPAFRDVQSQKAPAHSLASAAAAAAPLEERLENPWFKAIENAVFASLRSAISDEVRKAQDASKAEREKARAQAEALEAQWKAFTAKLEPKFAERHRFLPDHDGQLSRLFEGFPADLADLDRIGPAVETAFGAESPDAELAKIEESLSGLEAKGNLTRESRQLLYTLRVTVGALRGLFTGKTEEAVAGDLSSLRQKLKDLGGPAGDLKKYGPRVEKVFAAPLR